MAEEVDIGNVGGQNGVASEATLARLTASIEAMAKKAGIDPKAEAAKLQKLHNEAVKSGITTFDNSKTAQEDNTKATGKATESTNKFARAIGGAMMGAVGAAVGSIKGFGNELLQGGDSFSDFTKHLPIVGTILGPLASMIDNSLESYRQLSTIGAGLGNDINKVRLAAAQMGLSMSEYTGFVMGSADAMRMLGGNVQAGQMRFQKINKQLKDSGDFEFLKNLGFTIMDVNEGMATYVEQQRNLGRLEGKSTKELAAGSAAYLKQVDLLARATGMSRKEAEAELAAQATDAGIRGMLNALGEGTKEFENLQISLGLINKFGGPAADSLKDLLDGVVNDERTGKFLAALGPGADDVRDALTKVGEGADPQILLDAFSTAGGRLEEFAGITGDDEIDAAKKRKAFIDGIRASEPEIAAVLDFATKAKDAGNINLDNLREEQKRSNESTKLATSFDDKVKELRGAIQEIIINSGLLDEVMLAFGTFTDILGSEDFKKAIKDMVEAFASKTKEFIGLFKEGGFKAVFTAAVGDIGGVLGEAFLSAITNPKVILGIAGAFAALFALKAVSGAFVSGIGGLFGGGGGKGSAPGTSGSSKTSGGAKVGKNVGGFLGGLGEGVLKGAAAGLRAFAHPMVPIGAAAIGAAIVAIGAGIAGASWILGKALPTFVDGLKSFEDLDGDALGSAATGMVKLSGAMAAFGAGTAVAGLGSLVGGITQGIVSLFGGDDPLEKVKKFSEAKIDGKRVEANAKALVAFSTAMSAAGSAEAATGLGGLVGGIAGGIGSMFGGTTDPLIDLKTFGDTKVNGAQVKSNAEAMVAYADAMTAVAPGATQGLGELVGNIAGGIGKLFGVEKSDPTKDLETFGNLNINSGQVKTNAEAMVAFGEAMSSLPPTMPGDGVFTTFGKAIAGFFGAETPFEQLQNFGNLQFDAAKVKTNSEALVAFGTALASMPTDELGTLKLDKTFVTNLKNLSMVDGQGLNTVQTSLANIVNTPNLKTTLADLNDLGNNYKNVEDLAEAMEDLADAMKEVNQQSKNTSRGRNAGRGNNNETSSASASIIAGSGTGSGNDQLNSIMSRIEILLSEMRDTDRKILTATQNNAGNVAIALGN